MNLLARKRNKSDVINALSTLPKELDSTYDEALARIDEQNEEDRQLARRVLIWVTASFHQLSIKQLQIALAILPGDSNINQAAFVDEDILLSVCCGLVTVETESGVVGFIHDTVRDYFDRMRDSYLTNPHRDIAITCLSVLNLTSHGQELWVKDLGKDASALLEYAVNTWGFHATNGGTDDYVSRLILCYLENPAHSNLTRRYISMDFIPITLNVGSWKFDVSQTLLQSFNCLHLVSLFFIPAALGEKLLSICTCEAINHDPDASGWTPLSFAIKCGHEEFAKLLIKDDRVNINAGGGTLLGTALHAAVSGRHDHQDLIKLLLLKGANVRALRWNARTPLHDASEAGNFDAVRILLASGSDQAALTSSGLTPLYRAIRGGNIEVVRLLYRREKNVNIRTWDFWTPLHEAACCNNAFMIKVLLEYGADTSIRNINGHTAYDLAESLGNDQARYALSTNVDVSVSNLERREPYPQTIKQGAKITESGRETLECTEANEWIRCGNHVNSHQIPGDVCQGREVSFGGLPQCQKPTISKLENIIEARILTDLAPKVDLEYFSIDRLMRVHPALSEKLANRLSVLQQRSYAQFNASKMAHEKELIEGQCRVSQMGHLCCNKELARIMLLLVVKVIIITDLNSLSTRADSLLQRLSDSCLQEGEMEKSTFSIPFDLPNSIECPLCFNVVLVESRLGWILHVVSDLEPYTYTVYETDRSFSRQLEWKRYDQVHYPTIMSQCPFPECGRHPSPIFFQRHQIIDHILTRHGKAEVKPSSQMFIIDGKTLSLEDLLLKSQLRPQRKTPTSCIFCGAALSSLPMYCDHATAHREQIALQVLRKFIDDHYMD